jgi:hypothetical protein
MQSKTAWVSLYSSSRMHLDLELKFEIKGTVTWTSKEQTDTHECIKWTYETYSFTGDSRIALEESNNYAYYICFLSSSVARLKSIKFCHICC